MEIVVGIGADRALKIGHSGREVSKLDFGNAAAIERVSMIGARVDRLVIRGASAREVAVVEIEQSEFFVISCGGIIEDDAFQFLNPASTRKDLKRSAQQARVG